MTRTGVIIGCRAPRPAMRKPTPLPACDPLAPARGMLWGTIGGLTLWALLLGWFLW